MGQGGGGLLGIGSIGGLIQNRQAMELGRRDAIHAGQEARQHNIDMFKKESEFASVEAAKSRQWSKNMANTEMTRSVADLKRAGLNPLLAIGGGSTPGTSQAQASASSAGGQTPVFDTSGENMAHSALDTINKGNAAKKFSAEMAILKSQNKNIQANTTKQSREGNVLQKEETMADIINNAIKWTQKTTKDAVETGAKKVRQWFPSTKNHPPVKIGGPK